MKKKQKHKKGEYTVPGYREGGVVHPDKVMSAKPSSGYENGGVVGQPPLEGAPSGVPSDPTQINATPGEVVIPQPIVTYLGQKFFNDLIQKVQMEMQAGAQPAGQFADLAGAAPGEGALQ